MLTTIIHRQLGKVATLLSDYTYGISSNHKRKYLWFRVPKCATRTIDEILAEPGYIYGSYRGYFPWLYKDYYKFAFVRNPISRFISCYNDKVASDCPYQGRYSRKVIGYRYFPKMTLDEFIDYTGSLDVDSPATDPHIRSQVSMIDVDNMDYIGRVETLKESLKVVLDVINMPCPPELPHINKSKDVMGILNTQQYDKLKKIYARDFELIEWVKKGVFN
jgi:hypothetical protein